MAKTAAPERFRRWADSLGMSRTQLAAKLGVDSSTISNLIHGTRLPGRRAANLIERLTAGWPGGPITSEEWDAVEAKSRAKAS